MKRRKSKPVKGNALEKGASSQPANEHRRLPAAGGGRRQWVFRLVAALFIPLVFLGLLEVVLRIVGYGYDSNFFLKTKIGGEEFFIQNELFSRRFFPPETMRQPGAFRMKAVKPPGSIRIFVLGESAAMGDPEPAFGPARYMEMLLRQRYPGVDFEVIDVAFTAISSHVILPIARECARHDADAWIVYMGNNEMVGPFGASSVFGAQAPPLAQVRVALALQRFRTGQLINNLGHKFRGPSTDYTSWGGMQMFLKNQVAATDPVRQVVRDNFQRNLEDIVRAGVESHAIVLLNTVAVNLKDSPPFVALTNPDLSKADQAVFEQRLAQAQVALSRDDPAGAIEQFQAAAQIDPDNATLHYEWGMALLQLSNSPAAREQFQQACDADALAFRTDSHLNRIIRETAKEWPETRVRFVDAETGLESFSESGIVGEETFYEHVHFNFAGAYHLGLLWAQAIAGSLSDRLPAAPVDDWASQITCERMLGLTDWNRKVVIGSMVRRLQQPPLINQAGGSERLERLQQRERAASAGMNREAYADAREVYESAIATRPDDHFLYESYAGFLQSTGDLAGAAQAWRHVSELMPHDFLSWFQVGVLLARQGRHGEAQPLLRKALGIRPSLVEGWSELGQSLGATREWTNALACFDTACELRPQDPMLWAYRAKVLGKMGRSAGAVESYRRAIRLNPTYREAHGALGDLLAQTGRFREALSEYEAAIQLKPDDVTVNFNCGVMLLRMGRTEEGRQMFQRVLQLNPNHALAREYLVRLSGEGEAQP